MTPITFNGCFGWLHQGAVKTAHGTPVLLCSGLNQDALNSYHAQRLLAAQLSESGYPTMRFDYPQTGDSDDVEGFGNNSDIDLWKIWLDSIDQAAEFLLRATGARRLILCGLRIGATLAALAAVRRKDVAGLILLSPVLKGHSYLRQLWIQAQLYEKRLPPMEHEIRFQDIYFNQKTVQSITAVNICSTAYSGDLKIAVFARSQGRLLEDCCCNWSGGADVFRFSFAGLEPMLSLNIEDDKAHPNFTPLVQVQDGSDPPRIIVENLVMTPAGCMETPLHFGSRGQLFGILCQPENMRTNDVVLVVNTGRDPRHSPGRFNVEFSRILARQGIASLRFDFSGLGDSLGSPGQESILSSLMDHDRSDDLSAAIDMLERLGFRRFTAYGLCAGAYHSMRAAVADQRISRLLLINIPVFSWTSGARIDFIRHKNMPPRYFLSELLKLNSWTIAGQKLQKSRSVLRGQAIRLSTKFANAPWSPLAWLDRTSGVKLTAGQKSMEVLSRRRVKTLLLFGEGDLGLDAVAQEFGTHNPVPALGDNVIFQVLPDFDHLVSHERTRRHAARCMIDFLEQTGESSARHAARINVVPEAQASLSN
jgi:pimeloyl-ACP methyl ester carboxylesterase